MARQPKMKPDMVPPGPGGCCGACKSVQRRTGSGTGLFNLHLHKKTLCECCRQGYHWRPPQSLLGRATGEGECVDDNRPADPSRPGGSDTTKVGIKFDKNNELQWFANGTRVAGTSLPPQVRQQILQGYMQKQQGQRTAGGPRRSERLANRRVHFHS